MLAFDEAFDALEAAELESELLLPSELLLLALDDLELDPELEDPDPLLDELLLSLLPERSLLFLSSSFSSLLLRDGIFILLSESSLKSNHVI